MHHIGKTIRLKMQSEQLQKIFVNYVPDKGLMSKIHKALSSAKENKLNRHFSKQDIQMVIRYRENAQHH